MLNRLKTLRELRNSKMSFAQNKLLQETIYVRVRVLASAVDDWSSTALARTHTPGTLLKHKPIQTIWYAATPPRLAYIRK